MGNLVSATNEQAYLKVGCQGFAGSGKSRTCFDIAIGIHKFIKSEKPIAFIDTETGSDWLLPIAKKEGIEILRPAVRSRAFVHLMSTLEEAEKLCDVVIVDSVTHFWQDLVQSFQKKKGIERLSMHHWGPIKEEWKPYTDFFIESKMHFMNCGRAGWEFDYAEDEEGFKQLTKTGTRMKGEGELAFEPSLMIEMERARAEEAVGKVGQGFVNRMWIIKDRSDTINGKCFELAKNGKSLLNAFDCILPHVKCLNLGGEHSAIAKGDSQGLFANKGGSMSQEYKQREIFMEELTQELQLRFNQRTDEDKKTVIRLLQHVFGTASTTALGGLQSEELRKGIAKIKEMKIEEIKALGGSNA